jgi:hypothetical protein
LQLERLAPIKTDSSLWVDEAIWGHRLYDEQTPWLCFLEFLGVAAFEQSQNRPFIEQHKNKLAYISHRRLHLRNILFNNPFLQTVLLQSDTDETRWKQWLALMDKAAGGLQDTDFSYLKSRFSTFGDFAKLVQFLQASSIEGDSNKRWSSKFVFPYGPNSLYEDLRVAKTEVSNDRRFFARTGELLYLMICRSGKTQEVWSLLSKMGLIDGAMGSPSTRKWNHLVGLLQPGMEQLGKAGSSPYLPYASLVDFEKLAQDWVNLADCNMPSYDAVPHLVTITGLHMLLYFLRRSCDVLDCSQPTFVLEIVSPKKTSVRELATDSYIENDGLSEKAIRHHINQITHSPEWLSCAQDGDPVGTAKVILEKQFGWGGDESSTPEDLLESLTSKTLGRHRQHIRKFHNTWSREIGLASSRASRRTRYAPTDALLKTLVFSSVQTRMEFQEFLQVLYEKYGFIIGDRQAASLIAGGAADQEAFGQNAVRLEERLARLGLLKRLSDACAYVQNPYALEQNRASN